MEISPVSAVIDQAARLGSLLGLGPRTLEEDFDLPPFVSSARFETEAGLSRILLVEDDVYLRLALKERLTNDGCQVTEIGDGISALYCLLSQEYEAVVLDLSLPNRNGFEVMEEVALQRALPPILVLTGAEMDERYLARSLGASIVLKKPAPYPEIAEALASLLR